VRLFIGGILFGEYLFAAVTPSNTVTALMTDIDCTLPGNAIILAAGVVMIANVNTGTSAAIRVQVFYGDY